MAGINSTLRSLFWPAFVVPGGSPSEPLDIDFSLQSPRGNINYYKKYVNDALRERRDISLMLLEPTKKFKVGLDGKKK